VYLEQAELRAMSAGPEVRDVCSTPDGTAEVCYQVADHADYMIASEEITYVMFPGSVYQQIKVTRRA
jgi:hypothetical protein